MGGSCIYDYNSPCEDCGRCKHTLRKCIVNEKYNETYYLYSTDGGITWREAELD